MPSFKSELCSAINHQALTSGPDGSAAGIQLDPCAEGPGFAPQGHLCTWRARTQEHLPGLAEVGWARA